MDGTAVLVAVVTAVPATVAAGAAVIAALTSKKTDKVVQGNGQGPVDKMLENVLAWQQRHDERHIGIDGRLTDLEQED